MLNYAPLILAISMATIDVLTFPLIREISVRHLSMWYMLAPVILYAIQPMIFKLSMDYSSMTSMNLMWDITSDILVSIVGFWILKERFGIRTAFGIGFGMVSLFFFTWDADSQEQKP
jgi:drug/metabolite transporter (DMT)-like permease